MRATRRPSGPPEPEPDSPPSSRLTRAVTVTAPVLMATAVVLFGGTVHGLRDDHPEASLELAQAAARLDGVATTVGDWAGVPLDLDAKSNARVGIKGGLFRRYTNRRTGDVVTLLLVTGRPGPISVHTPDVCYASAGYQLVGAHTRVKVPSGPGRVPGEFWKIRMLGKGSPTPEFLDIHYAWSATGAWRAPDSDPRFQFASFPFLYKLDVVRRHPAADEPAGKDPGSEFLRELLPELTRALFSAL
jgi:hypothetical protein